MDCRRKVENTRASLAARATKSAYWAPLSPTHVSNMRSSQFLARPGRRPGSVSGFRQSKGRAIAPSAQQGNGRVDTLRNRLVRRDDRAAASGPGFPPCCGSRKKDFRLRPKGGTQIVERQRIAVTIVVEGIAGIVRHLKIVDQDDRVSEMLADDLVFLAQRQVIVPMRVKIEEGRFRQAVSFADEFFQQIDGIGSHDLDEGRLPEPDA